MGNSKELIYFDPDAERKKIRYNNLPGRFFKLEMIMRAGFCEQECANVVGEIENGTDEDWEWQAATAYYSKLQDFIIKFRDDHFGYALKNVCRPMLFTLWFKNEKDRNTAKRILDPFSYDSVRDPAFVIFDENNDESEENV